MRTGRFRFLNRKESARVVRGHAVKSGWSPRSGFPEHRLGECGSARYSSLSARKGIQVVPRKIFRPESIVTQGVS